MPCTLLSTVLSMALAYGAEMIEQLPRETLATAVQAYHAAPPQTDEKIDSGYLFKGPDGQLPAFAVFFGDGQCYVGRLNFGDKEQLDTVLMGRPS